MHFYKRTDIHIGKGLNNVKQIDLEISKGVKLCCSGEDCKVSGGK